MKKDILKNRTVRLSDHQWDSVKNLAKQDDKGKTRPSDIVRNAIDCFIKDK